MTQIFLCDEYDFFTSSLNVPVGIEYANSTQEPIPDIPLDEGMSWKWGGTNWVQAERPAPIQLYKDRGLDVTALRKLYGYPIFLADRVRDDLSGDLSYLQCNDGIESVDEPAFLLGMPGITYRDVLRTTFISFYSAPVINCDDDEFLLGLRCHYFVGILSDIGEVARIRKGVPL